MQNLPLFRSSGCDHCQYSLCLLIKGPCFAYSSKDGKAELAWVAG